MLILPLKLPQATEGVPEAGEGTRGNWQVAVRILDVVLVAGHEVVQAWRQLQEGGRLDSEPQEGHGGLVVAF